MEIKCNGSQPSAKGPAEYFTGAVRLGPLFNPRAPARAFGASVTIEPGARAARRPLPRCRITPNALFRRDTARHWRSISGLAISRSSGGLVSGNRVSQS
jgi:hypothetical protein